MKIEDQLNEKQIIEHFKINGLYGYKDIGIGFEKNVKIVAADNGAGKTTLLHALYAVLTRNSEELFLLNYKEIIIKLRDMDELTLIKKYNFPLSEEIANIIDSYGIDEEKKIRILTIIDYRYTDILRSMKFEIDSSFRRSHGIILFSKLSDAIQEILVVELSESEKLFREIRNFLKTEIWEIKRDVFTIKENSENKEFFNTIENYLLNNNINIIYQPTYRRIEKQLPGIKLDYDLDDEIEHSYIKNRNYRFRDNNLIQFGLDDVRKNIDRICEEIRNITLEGYNKLSENILELFLVPNKNIDKDINEGVLIDTLKLFLNRLGKQEKEIDKYIISFKEKYSKNINGEIVSFLKQLVPVVNESNHLEEKINSFGNVINSYLKYDTQEEKEFIFDTNRVTAKVINKITSQELDLNSLSSGEKQIFNIFSKLYLENNKYKKYIVLFDEPELSLSLDWQKKFLPDIFRSPSCIQLFAITHSPFIFDNELKYYSGSLVIRNYKK